MEAKLLHDKVKEIWKVKIKSGAHKLASLREYNPEIFCRNLRLYPAKQVLLQIHVIAMTLSLENFSKRIIPTGNGRT